MSLSLKKKVRLFALLALLAAITVIITSFNITSKSEILENQEKLLSLRADTDIAFLGQELSHIKQDIIFLSNSNALKVIVNQKQKNHSLSDYKSQIINLEASYSRFIQSRDNYVKIRLIGIEDNGQEIIKISDKGDITDLTTPENLEKHANHSYFSEALKLSDGDIYISMADDNREAGVVVRNNSKSVIRFSKPIYTNKKKIFGILAIDVDLKNTLKHIEDELTKGDHLVIELPNGKYIIHMYKGELTEEGYVRKEVIENVENTNTLNLPEFFEGFVHSGKEINIVSDKIIIHKHFELTKDEPLNLIIGKKVNQLKVGSVPFLNDNKYMPVPILLSIILVSIIFTGLPIRQVEKLNETIQSISRGTRRKENLPVHLNNEIGDLSRSFRTLLDKLEKNENELYRAKEQLELAISGALGGLWDWDVKNNKFDVSEQFLGMIGHDDKTLNIDNDTLTNLIHPDDIDRLKKFTEAYFERKEKKYEIEFRLKHKQGYYIDILSRGAAIRDGFGNVTRMIGINTDITERKQQIRNQIVFEKMQKKALVREVHHRIKNNLQGVASLLRQHVEQRREYKGELNTAISQVYTMAMVHGIQGKGIDGSIYVEHMLNEIIGITRDISGIQIAVSGINDYCKYRIEENEAVPIALVLNELVTNACKHSKDESPVNIQVTCDWCGHEEISIVILNQSLPFQPGFDFSEKLGLGTGLNLVSSLLPPTGSSLDIREENGLCRTELVLGKPVIFVESKWEYVKLNQV